MARTSRLDFILDKFHKSKPADTPTYNVFHEQAKKEIKLLFLEVIGEDEPKPTDCCDNEGGVICLTESKVKARNKLKAELRQLVEAL